ncbi:MAG: hypothetical protein U5K28_11155 [Halobacteriales archaeon]|nr:hypothetical protein [Halobacteriales archaeon]
MVSVADIVGLLVILGVNTTVAALLTRLFRVQLNTQWGPIVYSVLLTPLVLVILVLVMGGAGLGPNLGSASAVLGLTVVMPLALGMSFDYFWQPSPDEVQVPDNL